MKSSVTETNILVTSICDWAGDEEHTLTDDSSLNDGSFNEDYSLSGEDTGSIIDLVLHVKTVRSDNLQICLSILEIISF